MSDVERTVAAIAAPLVEPLGLRVFDVEHHGGTLRVAVDKEDGGADLDLLAEAARAISAALDVDDPIPGRYTLEVSTPGLERPLRRPDHYRWAVGRDVAVKLRPEVDPDGDRRVRGEVAAADEDGVVLLVGDERRTIAYEDIESARTIFEWGPAPKPGSPEARERARTKRVTT